METSSSDVNAQVTGPFLLGYLLNYGLYGVLTVQVYIYYNAFPNDRRGIQAMVYGLYVVETVQTVMVTWDAFQNFVFGFGQPAALEEVHLVWLDCCITDGIVAFVAQTFYAYRIYVLSKSKLLLGVIVSMALTQLGGAAAAAEVAKAVGTFTDRQRDFTAVGVWLGGSAACDIVIAVSMTYILSKCDAGFQETRDILNRIVRLTMETGILTATVATIDLVLFLVLPQSSYHMTPALILAKLYSNSLMVIFNSRVQIVGGRGQSKWDEKHVEIFNSKGELVFETRNFRHDGMFVFSDKDRKP
ncbi:hypothetical protein L218DRAFT_937646 [Marasmius fiardii PR-910]|nr:hypothetical protein L218DRAFT_937646 [Marasmius fiardii PR-910]